MVIWLTGMSGSGKTTIGRSVYSRWKRNAPNTVLVDGDEIRKIFRHDSGPDAYTIEGRAENARRIAELCAWLDRQQINVVCCILSIFEGTREWNRENLSEYFEVFIDIPFETLLRRDNKNLYRPALEGKIKNVVGVDIEFTAPRNSDMVMDNSHDGLDAEAAAEDILQKAGALA